ncbi:hypothetical protein K504DRAFT_483679 [Pleomassaria siparia CBS 279.74]|uniref:DNA polymerase n=1 Tax=Pleomassaria siparia CBS 279.74 TaxID=1314801 RepID=A0A6G1K1S6_9PLEO|nr:hypothetical protein K504DRAFT_483679 [Pleomassaria siparia CBS 279.74]
MPPPPLSRVQQRSSFLGPTPRERRAEFEASISRKTAQPPLQVTRSATEPDMHVSKTFPSARPNAKRSASPEPPGPRKKLKHTTSLPNMVAAGQMQDQTLFYKTMGDIPRELRSAKHVPLAENIRLDPKHKQLLKGKIICKIHKVIQLGGAWIKCWRDDVNFVFMDEDIYTYNLLLRHLKKTELPSTVTVTKFEPYIPQCIEFATLLNPSSKRFLVKGAPQPVITTGTDANISLISSQASPQVKQSRRQAAAAASQKTTILDSFLVKDSFPPPPGTPLSKPADSSHDELSEAIQQTKAVAHLLDDDDDSSSSDTNAQALANQESDPSTDDEAQRLTPKRLTSKLGNSKAGLRTQTFQCMNPGGRNSLSQNPNARTIEILGQMGQYYDEMNDSWRTLAYRRAAATLRKQSAKVSTAEEAEELRFIGKRLAQKIEEIVFTDRLRRLDNTRDDPRDKTLRLFRGVYGAGLSQANKWIQQGYSTLEDLADKAKLTENQKIGIDHYEDFAARIPRAEVKAHGEFVRDALQKIHPGFDAQVMGSYRRGAKDSGDIDVMITSPGASMDTLRNVVFEQLVSQLFKQDFLKAKLATSSHTNNGTKWHGASCLPTSKVWRRLDLLIAPEEELGAALIYFTGNDIFNRSLRLLASKRGMRLNQRGLYKDVIRGKNREKITNGTLVEGRDERRIFEILGVPWTEPTERIC